MKKAFCIICLFFASALFAEEFCNGEFWYEINKNDEVIIFEYMSKKGFVQISSEIDGKKVKGIRNTTFERTNFISSVTIPDSVELIEYWAFGLCKALASFYGYNSVPCIEEKIFLDNDYVVVHCNEGTSVEKYCQENNIKYSIIPEWLK